MDAIDYDFQERMIMSDGTSESTDVRQVLIANIPGARNVIRSHEDNDRTGVDWWVEMSGGYFLAVDTKIRAEDYAAKGQDDLALETWSVVESYKVGWTRDSKKRTDYVLWFWKDTGRFCLIPFAPLCAVFSEKWQDWKKAYKTSRQRTPPGEGVSKEYHSECVFVPRHKVWAEIYNKYNGKINVTSGTEAQASSMPTGSGRPALDMAI